MLCLVSGHSPYAVVVTRAGRRTEVRGTVTARSLLQYLEGAAKAERLLDDAAS